MTRGKIDCARIECIRFKPVVPPLQSTKSESILCHCQTINSVRIVCRLTNGLVSSAGSTCQLLSVSSPCRCLCCAHRLFRPPHSYVATVGSFQPHSVRSCNSRPTDAMNELTHCHHVVWAFASGTVLMERNTTQKVGEEENP